MVSTHRLLVSFPIRIKKKAGGVENFWVLDHAGLLFDGRPEIAGLSFV